MLAHHIVRRLALRPRPKVEAVDIAAEDGGVLTTNVITEHILVLIWLSIIISKSSYLA